MDLNFDKSVKRMGIESACHTACLFTALLGCLVCLAGEAGFGLGASASCAVASWE
ncbi:hypothetical protein I4U23_015746 [Adineta vaga]|nr:hypothetical protein I4U23_015746 [Adineta vaga]